MKNTIILLAGIDSHLPRIKEAYSYLSNIYSRNDIDFGITTFGNITLPPSVVLKDYSEKEGFVFYDDKRQIIPNNREFHCSETLALLSIFKYYYGLGYKDIFILQNDMWILKDFIPLYKEHMIGNWSFVIPFLNINTGSRTKEEYEKAVSLGSFGVVNTPYRLPQTIITLNKDFVNKVYEVYGDNENLWSTVFSKFYMTGDVSLFDIPEWLGYKINPVMDNIESALRWCPKEKLIQEFKNKTAYCVHGKDTCDILRGL